MGKHASTHEQQCKFYGPFDIQMITLYRDPSGKKIFDKSNQTETTVTFHTLSKDQNAETEMIRLQNKVREQEESIHIKDRKISELEKTLMNIEV